MKSIRDNWSSDFIERKNSTSSKPVYLYEVYLGEQDEVDNNTLFFNSSNYSFDYFPYRDLQEQQVYIALGVDRGDIARGINNQIESVPIILDNVSTTFSTLFNQQDYRGKRIIIRQIYSDCTANTGDYDLLFDGILDTPEMSLEDGAKFDIKHNILDSLNYTVPKESYYPHCNNRFLDEYCANGISATTLKATKTGQTFDTIISQVQLQDTARTEGTGDYWKPAIIEMTAGTAGNIGEKRKVISQSGDILILESNFPNDVQVADEYTIERDCDKSFENCKYRLDNEINFRGFKYLPTQIVVSQQLS